MRSLTCLAMALATLAAAAPQCDDDVRAPVTSSFHSEGLPQAPDSPPTDEPPCLTGPPRTDSATQSHGVMVRRRPV